MRAAKSRSAKRHAWLGVTALGVLACSLALAGAPARKPAPIVGQVVIDNTKAASDPSHITAQQAVSQPTAEAKVESQADDHRVRGGQMPPGEYPVIANVVVDYRDDEMTKARARGELRGPLPMPSGTGGVATGGCTFDIACDDGNPCTLDTCNLPLGSPIGTGKCETDPVPNGANSVFGGGFSTTCDGERTCGCDDDNYCNGFETCQGAVCAGGSAGLICDGGSNDGNRCLVGGDCPDGSCVTAVGTACDAHSDCQSPGVCNTTTSQCTTGGPGACTSNFDCGLSGTGTCNAGSCTNGQMPTCCADAATCLPEFATCSEDSDNPGDPCQTDQECRGDGRCNRCADLCKNAADCDDKSKCNGVEICGGMICRAGTNNGTPCTTDANCTGGGKCLGICARGAPPCGFDADCDEGHCSGGTKANKVCSTDVDCPGGFCGLHCQGGPNNGFACGNTCPGPVGTVCDETTYLCSGGINVGRGCADCETATCGAGIVCYPGRCCSTISEPVCTQSRIAPSAPPALCVGNWYSGDGGRELTEGNVPGCGGGPVSLSENWGCPKYSGGFTQTNINNPPQRLVTVGPVSDSTVSVPLPGGPGGPLNKLGDDYTLTNNSYIGLDVLRFVGGPITAADRIIFEFYDASNVIIEDIVLPGIVGTDIGVVIVQLNPALTIPATGSVVARAASNFSPNTRFVWMSTTNPVAVGTNNPNSLWVNGGPAANFLSPNPGTLAFELAGDKTPAPFEACCNSDTGVCADGVLPWVCVFQGNIPNGQSSKCAKCNAGTQTGQGCRTCSGNGTTPCNSNADCTIVGGTCTPDGDLCPPALKCVGGSNPGALCPGGSGCLGGGTCSGKVCSNNINQTCVTPANCAPGVGVTCDLPQCIALAACAGGACCDPNTGDCTVTTGSCGGNFQGFGTSCDADDGLGDPAKQHCCPQPDLGLKCMGGPNNLQTCDDVTDCRFCVEGTTNGNACSVHADCARCVGGSTPGAVCSVDLDCPGEGVCTGHCLGECVTRGTGADNCADAMVHVITVPASGADPVTVTITGNNNPASSTVANPDSCWDIATGVGSEPGWWESFSINDCAWVRLDFCCTKPVHEPAWAFLATDCACDNTLPNTPNPYHFGEVGNFRGPKYCDEDNLWQSFGPLPAGTYYYPIYSVLAGHHGQYQMHITVEACPDAACCKPDGSCVEVNQGECDGFSPVGYWLGPPQVSPAVPLCLPGTCTAGSCCVAPGDCRDQVSETDPTVMTEAICNSVPFEGNFVGGTRCFGGECVGGGDDGESCKVAADCAAPGNCTGTDAQLAAPNPCPLCEYFGAATCDLEAGPYVWRSDASTLTNPTRQCNDIMPTATAVLREMCVLGHYIGFPAGVRTDNCEDADGGVTDSFTVRLYAPDPHRYFPGEILGEWATSHLPNPRGEARSVSTWGAGQNFYDFQLTLIPTPEYPLVELQSGQIYFLEISNNTTGGMPECDFWMLDNGPNQGNNYAFLDTCGTTYTEDSVKLFVDDPDAMRDPSWCLNVPYNPPPTPVRACCTGDPLTPCVELPIRDCAEIAGDWQFGQLECSGYVCPVEPNNLCSRAPYVKEGSFGVNMFGATRDGNEFETCAEPGVLDPQDFAGDVWFFYQPSAAGQALITTCDCERGGDEVIAVYRNPGNTAICPCPGDLGMTLVQCRDAVTPNWLYPADGCPFAAAADVVLNVDAGACYTVRVATDVGATPTRANLRIALNPAACGNGTREVAGGEQCDPGNPDAIPPTTPDDALCPGDCQYTCLCPEPVCGKQCVGGQNDNLACTTIADCPGGTNCVGKLEAALGEECDSTAGGAGIAPCTDFFTTCRLPGDPDGECTCVPSCGNGRREGGELCDGADDDICAGAGCTGQCRCLATCGNGVTEIGEQCDPGGPGSIPPPSDSLCKDRCISTGLDACTCPPPLCGNDYTEALSNDEECDGLDLAGESICPGEPCRPPGDPAGECTCVCSSVDTPPNTVVWDPTLNPGPWPNANPLATTRTLRFTVTGPDGPSKPEAIKVTMVDLQHPKPANLAAQAPPNFTTYDTKLNGVCNGGSLSGHHCDVDADCPPGVVAGRCSSLVACTADPTCTSSASCVLPSNSCTRWVGELATFLESQDSGIPGGTYKAARLQCTPYYWDWKPEGLITVVGAEIAPSSEYSVQVYGASCIGAEAGCTAVSPGVTMYTRRSGDAAPNFNPPATSTQPDALDVAAVVNKLKVLPGALVKAITQLQPNLPEQNADVNALDIVAVVDGVRGLKYGFSGPCPCPSTVTCGLTACPAGPGVCVTAYGAGAQCVKTCVGGANIGDPCINAGHCPGSTCGAGFCRDRCGRCTPP